MTPPELILYLSIVKDAALLSAAVVQMCWPLRSSICPPFLVAINRDRMTTQIDADPSPHPFKGQNISTEPNIDCISYDKRQASLHFIINVLLL